MKHPYVMHKAIASALFMISACASANPEQPNPQYDVDQYYDLDPQYDTNGLPIEKITVTPNSMFQYSSLTGSGNTIIATRVPVVTSTGAMIYKDVTLLFAVSAVGNLTLTAGYPKVVASPGLLVSAFKAGKYVGPSTNLEGAAKITVSGPSIGAGGTTIWSIAASTGAHACTYPSSATWYVGPLASNPLYARIKAVGITSTAYSYGIGSAVCYAELYYRWTNDTLIGVNQIGNTITIVSFTHDDSDLSYPIDQITYTLVP